MTDSPIQHRSDARNAVMNAAIAIAGEIPTPKLRSLICPFCGTPTPDTGRCQSCNARFDPLSRQATQNQMGTWSIRDEQSPFRPGCTYETLIRLIEQGVVRADTVLRGPTTRQFWTLARHTPSIAQRFGVCHNCQHSVDPKSSACTNCHASFLPERDRQHLGVGPLRPLPGQMSPAATASQAEPASLTHREQQPTASQTLEQTRVGPAGYADDAGEVIRQWRHAFNAERKRAWIAVGLAGLVTIIALASSVLGYQRAPAEKSSNSSVE